MIFIPLVICILGMWGGQKYKASRRIGIPAFSVYYVFFRNRQGKEKRKYFWLMILSLFLSMGYGENSLLMKRFKKDWLVRIIYGLLLSTVFIYLGFWEAVIILPLAYSIRSHWLGLVDFYIYKTYQFVWEDCMRFSALGYCIYKLGG